MDFFHSVTAQRIIFSLGLLNLITGLAIFFTCRCIPRWKSTNRLTHIKGYAKFSQRVHCNLWFIFWPSVIVHAVLAIIFAGVPI